MKKTLWVKNKGWKWWHWFCRMPIRSFSEENDGLSVKMLFLGPFIRFSGTDGIIDMITEQTEQENAETNELETNNEGIGLES